MVLESLRRLVGRPLPSSRRRLPASRLGASVVLAVPLFFAAGDAHVGSSTSSSATGHDPYEVVADYIDRDAFERLPRRFRDRLVHAAMNPGQHAKAACFMGFVPPDFIQAFDAILQGGVQNPIAFQLTNKWNSSALTPGPLGQGDPMILTYSFMPDGVFIPSEQIGPGANNDFRATFDGIFGSEAVWLPLFQQAFDDWGALTGVQYVYEPNDDGAAAFVSPGVPGVRGDVRIGGRPIDGGSGVLAFNFFPNGGGDMTFDTNDTGIWGSSGNNFRLLRNVIMHEHGHGLGLFHVCPLQQNKLMEPFLSGAFDGPQLDDFLGANRHYGDRNEPNDNQPTATSLGNIGFGSASVDNVTIDDNSDTDWYSFDVTSFSEVSIDLSPIGFAYPQYPQTQACNNNTVNFDATSVHDLGFELIAPDGSTTITLVDGQGLGQSETLPATGLLDGPGTYYIRVFGGSTNNVQGYSLDLSAGPFTPQGFEIDLAAGAPASIDANAVTLVNFVTIDSGFAGSPDPAGGTLFASVDGGAFLPTPLDEVGGSAFQGALPAVGCLSEVAYYVTIDQLGGVGGAVTFPVGGAANPLRTRTGTAVFADDFQTDSGWVVTNSAGLTDGAWNRGVPVDSDRGDPPADADGSGAAFLTDNAPGNSDVDGGQTFLTSPPFDLTGSPVALVRFQFWYDNEFGGNPNEDPFLIEIDSGSGFQVVESYNANANAWIQREFTVTGAPTAMRVRFTAQDIGGGSVVEAGVDAFEVVACPPLASLDASCAAGNVGGSGEDVWLIGNSAGGPSRRVIAAAGQPIPLSMELPSASVGTAPFAVFLQEMVPGPLDVTTIPGVGPLCIGPAGLAIGPLIDGAGAPFRIVTPGVPQPFEFTTQGVILESAGVARITNGITLDIR